MLLYDIHRFTKALPYVLFDIHVKEVLDTALYMLCSVYLCVEVVPVALYMSKSKNHRPIRAYEILDM